jgi:hypothetical protein
MIIKTIIIIIIIIIPTQLQVVGTALPGSGRG